jgi:hypothetical protein
MKQFAFRGKQGTGFSARCYKAALSILLLVLTSCGGNTGQGSPVLNEQKVLSGSPHENSFTINLDDYGLQKPNFYYSTDNAAFWSIQANIANDVRDEYGEQFKCVIRIDILKTNGMLPYLNKTFSIEETTTNERFPGSLYIFNGHKSVYKKVEQGSIAFTPGKTAGDVSGVYDVVMTDYDSKIVPAPRYHIAGEFHFSMGTYGPADPLPVEVFPLNGKISYDQFCSGCHELGEYDPVREMASDLSMRGGELPTLYPGAVSEHQTLSLSEEAMRDLRIFLNAY